MHISSCTSKKKNLHFHDRRWQFLILDLLRKTVLQVSVKMTTSFRLVCGITLNAVFFLNKKGIIQLNPIQLNNYILLASPPYKRRMSTQNLTLPELLRTSGSQGGLAPLSNCICLVQFQIEECCLLISVHMRAAGAGDNLAITTSSSHLCPSLFWKVRTAMCLRQVLVNLLLIK